MTNTVDELLTSAGRGTTYTPWFGFVVKGGAAVYTIEHTDRPDLPFTHKVITNMGPVYGYWSEHSGRFVRVQRNGWRNSHGVLGTFSTRDEPRTFEVKGWAVVAP